MPASVPSHSSRLLVCTKLYKGQYCQLLKQDYSSNPRGCILIMVKYNWILESRGKTKHRQNLLFLSPHGICSCGMHPVKYIQTRNNTTAQPCTSRNILQTTCLHYLGPFTSHPHAIQRHPLAAC